VSRICEHIVATTMSAWAYTVGDDSWKIRTRLSACSRTHHFLIMLGGEPIQSDHSAKGVLAIREG
jgi:hypothetical protein